MAEQPQSRDTQAETTNAPQIRANENTSQRTAWRPLRLPIFRIRGRRWRMPGCGLGDGGCASSPEDPSCVATDFEETHGQGGAIHTRRERGGARTESASPFFGHGGDVKHG